MQRLRIYVTEPHTINLDLVRASLRNTPHTLIIGNPDFTDGDYSICDTLIMRSVTRINSSIKGKMPLLSRIVRIGTGLDTIDLDFCDKAGIAVYNAPGANAEAVADYIVAVVSMAIRKLHLLSQDDIKTWNRFKFTGHSIGSRTIGIIGFGNTGKLVYEKFYGLGCTKFLLYDPYVVNEPKHAHFVTLDELLQNSDIITLHLPLLPQTRDYINKKRLELLRYDSILVNASRGGIVDEKAVIETLKAKRFTYVADTVEGEPAVDTSLIEHPDVIITPHIASLTHEAEEKMVVIAIDNLIADKRATTKVA